MKILIINTSDNKEVFIGIKIDGKEVAQRQKLDITKPQPALPMIDNILKENKIMLKDLDEIEVNTGPGSFTGIRVGLTIANTLSFVLKIPVNGKISDFAQPSYT